MEYAWVNGKVTTLENATLPILDRGLMLGDGLFETLRAVGHSPQFMDLHWKRLRDSAKDIRMPLPFSKEELQEIIPALCKKSKLDDATVRIVVTRGPYTGTLALDPKAKSTGIIFVRPVHGLPDSIYQKGVHVALTSIRKPAIQGLKRCIKATSYLPNILAKNEADKAKCFEGILQGEEGEIAELSTSSFFCVIDGVVKTPPLSLGILPGVTRHVILGLLRKHKIPFSESRIWTRDIPKMSEAFLTSSVRGAVPIVKIGKQKIGNGKPGLLTQKIRELYLKSALSV